jgi:septum formation protein
MTPVLVLASASPRRASILRALGVPFQVSVSGVDETLHPGEPAADAAERLAREKAAAVASAESLPVLAADTMVVLGDVILGKPDTPEEAARMVRMLSGKTHDVVTGVCLARDGVLRSAVDRTRVTFAALSDASVDWYVSTGEPYDKAGGYHIDGYGAALIESVSGSPSNVAGLPVLLVLRLARASGLRLGPP